MSFLKTTAIQHLNASAPAINLTANGDVGIGITNPTFDSGTGLEIQRADVSTVRIDSVNNSTALELKAAVGAVAVSGRGNYPLLMETNGIERMRIDSSGRVTMPYQPVFAASGSTTQSWSGSANYQTLQLNLQYVSNNSRGSGYNTSTYRFTAPVAGMYMFFGKITQTGTATGPSLFLFVNGNIANIYEMTIGYSVAYMSTSGLAPWYMNAGDYAELRVNNNNSVSQSLDLSRCNFVGWLLG